MPSLLFYKHQPRHQKGMICQRCLPKGHDLLKLWWFTNIFANHTLLNLVSQPRPPLLVFTAAAPFDHDWWIWGQVVDSLTGWAEMAHRKWLSSVSETFSLDLSEDARQGTTSRLGGCSADSWTVKLVSAIWWRSACAGRNMDEHLSL